MPKSERWSPYGDPADVRTLAVIGTGSVGSSWITLGLARGFEVLACDPRADAPTTVRAFVDAAWPSMLELGLTAEPTAPFERLRFVDQTTELAAADLMFEAVPERLDAKIAVLEELDRVASPATIIATSSGGMQVSALQAGCTHPERLVLLHPLNPAHLIPLVEVCGGDHTDERVVEWVAEFCRLHGKAPVVLHREVVGHLTNRLQAALLREAVFCLLEGIASADDIDTVVTMGLGARWSAIGPLMTLHLAGGTDGTAGILAHAGDAMSTWWDALGELRLTPDVRDRLIVASRDFGGGAALEELVRARDRRLVSLFRDQTQAST